mmetsp:Transcript_1908/g.4289  ORF Transcript_1908/g.4289 Transcript_1908/m.4289 type:complete len:502 (+) Transcript_1908:196-1701(+)
MKQWAVLCAGFFLAEAGTRELFTTNAVCRKNNCINPVFPGLEDLTELSKDSKGNDRQYQCVDLMRVSPLLHFCQRVVNYHFALPKPSGTPQPASQVIRQQEQQAITTFVYHLNGMGMEAWDYTRPWESDDECVKSVWRLSCYTYFPKCAAGTSEKGGDTPYLRPCGSSCQNYVASCNVECCDESVQCVFSHTKRIGSKEFKTEGYENEDGPSSTCTGAAGRTSLSLLLALFLGNMFTGQQLRKAAVPALLLMTAVMMQGCGMDAPTHAVGNWRAESDYLIKFEYIPPGKSARDSVLNSCAYSDLAASTQCNEGRGVCKPWDTDNLANPIYFCSCDRDWADPECRTARKSQAVAYGLSLFFGAFGADQFYLGYPGFGAVKLVSLGGLGIWWVWDVIRIGSAPVYASDFRTAADLPHWAFLITAVTFAIALGFLVVGCSTFRHIRRKRKDALMLQAEEEAVAQSDYPPYSTAYDHLKAKSYPPPVPKPGHFWPGQGQSQREDA